MGRELMAILTIARKYGSGGREVGKEIARQLNYEYVDRGRILKDMRAKGQEWEEKAKYFDENYPDVWERYDWSFRGFVALNQYHFLECALRDNVVIMGRGGNFLLRGIPHVFRVRVVASMEKRIENVIQRENVNGENARWLIERADREMAGAIHLIYGRNWDDPDEYDQVFDTGVQGFEEIVEKIKTGLQEKQKQCTEEGRETLRLRVLAAKVKAAITTNPKFLISVLEVEPKEEGMIEKGLRVRGIVHQQRDVQEIKEIAKRLAAPVAVECEVQYRWSTRLGPWRFK